MTGIAWRRELVDSALEHEALLTDDERQQALRFRFRADRDRFVAGRGLTRHLLGEALGKPGGALVLSGILERQADELSAAYAPHARLQVAATHDGWVLMTASL